MNLNKGCIEIIPTILHMVFQIKMNLNKGCIEIYSMPGYNLLAFQMNLNKGCIEISIPAQVYFQNL